MMKGFNHEQQIVNMKIFKNISLSNITCKVIDNSIFV